MATLVIIAIAMYVHHIPLLRMVIVIKKTLQQGREANATSEQDPYWASIPDGPVYGDTTDQGAVDAAIKLLELEEFEATEQDAVKKKALAKSIREYSDLLVELTLLPFGPRPEVEADSPPAPSKIIPFNKYKPFDDPNKR